MNTPAITIDDTVPAIEVFWDSDDTVVDTYTSTFFAAVNSGPSDGFQKGCNFEVVITAAPAVVENAVYDNREKTSVEEAQRE